MLKHETVSLRFANQFTKCISATKKSVKMKHFADRRIMRGSTNEQRSYTMSSSRHNRQGNRIKYALHFMRHIKAVGELMHIARFQSLKLKTYRWLTQYHRVHNV